ncbi:hypothetical protein YC2023_046005 [Brassica napus]
MGVLPIEILNICIMSRREQRPIFPKKYVFFSGPDANRTRIFELILAWFFGVHLLIKLTDPDIQTKKSRYPDSDSALTDPTFYYADPESWIGSRSNLGSNPDFG